MSQRYHVIHETLYRYASPVALSQHLLHLSPHDSAWQRVLHHHIEITPRPSEHESHADWFGNLTAWVAVIEPHEQLRLIAASTIEVEPQPVAGREAPGPAWELVAQQLASFPPTTTLDVQEFMLASPCVPLLEDVRTWALVSFTEGRPLLDAARHLMHRLWREFEFDPEASNVSTPVAEIFQRRRGVCQDFSQLMLSALRSVGLSARYVSGYILTHPAPGKPRLIGADASHAWVQLWCPENGWVGFDPTNDQHPNLEHVVAAYGRDFSDVTPMRGVILGGASHEVEAHVTMMPAEASNFAELLEAVRTRSLEKVPED
jgi:transglutaminase-like putative cysteine protease